MRVALLLSSLAALARALPQRRQFRMTMSSKDSRRGLLNTALLGSGLMLTPVAARAATKSEFKGFAAPPYDPELRLLGPDRTAFSLLPLAPGYRRKTLEAEVIPEQLWTHDQLLGIVNVNVPVRQIVVRLPRSETRQEGGLLVYNPVGPTPELLKMMRRLENKYGKVQHIVLASSALEHKTTAALFSQRFGDASVWYEPGQWSFPVSIPLTLEGFSGPAARGMLKPLPKRGEAPWSDVLDQKTLQPLIFKSVGTYSETAMFHKPSKTLILTDAVIEVPLEPPAIIQEDPRALLFHARDSASDFVTDSVEARRKGWRRMAQFALVFFPSRIDVKDVATAFRDRQRMDPRMRALGERAVPGGLFPWSWTETEEEYFVSDYVGGPFVPPILQKLIYDREPARVYAWASDIASWNFERIVPCHLKNVIKAGPKEFLAAFDFLRPGASANSKTPQPGSDDLRLLTDASRILTKLGVTAPSQVADVAAWHDG